MEPKSRHQGDLGQRQRTRRQPAATWKPWTAWSGPVCSPRPSCVTPRAPRCSSRRARRHLPRLDSRALRRARPRRGAADLHRARDQHPRPRLRHRPRAVSRPPAAGRRCGDLRDRALRDQPTPTSARPSTLSSCSRRRAARGLDAARCSCRAITSRSTRKKYAGDPAGELQGGRGPHRRGDAGRLLTTSTSTPRRWSTSRRPGHEAQQAAERRGLCAELTAFIRAPRAERASRSRSAARSARSAARTRRPRSCRRS